MTVHPKETPFVADWPAPAPRLLMGETPAAVELPLHQTFSPRWAEWIARAAEAKSAPPDYVVAGLLAVAGAAIGNTRWVAPWEGWAEPPVLWTMAIGSPSSNKSPGLDAVLGPLKDVEREARQAMEGERAEWCEAAELAKIAESTWREAAKAAIKEGAIRPRAPMRRSLAPNPSHHAIPSRTGPLNGWR